MNDKTKDPYRSPLWCIRQRCKNCVGWERIEQNIGHCQNTDCELWPYRTGHRPKKWPVETHGKKYSPRQAIKRYCLSCCLGQMIERKLCPADDCPLWKWRLGTPEEYKSKSKGLSAEQMERIRQKRAVISKTGNGISDKPQITVR